MNVKFQNKILECKMGKNTDDGSFFMDMINHECYNKQI